MSTFKERMAELRRNPSMMQYMVYNELDKALNGNGLGATTYDVPDATLPFAYAMECGIVETTTAIDEMESICRTLFPELANTPEDLYKHMSDDDYIGRFATPSKTTFELMLGYDEVVAKAIPFDNDGNRKLVIPRLTEFKVVDIPFTMQYPIEIKVSRHNGINITYNMDNVSPIETLNSNILDWKVLVLDRQKILSISIPVNQMRVKTYTDALSPSTLFQNSYQFTEEFFYARVYIDSGNGWKEVKTTHSDLVHDPLRVTVVLAVVDKELRVSIPAIYTNLNMVRGSIRVDVYTTAGELYRDLGSYKSTQFDWNLNDIDDSKTYVSPLRTFGLAQPIARSVVEGGTKGLSYNKLRDRVIDNTLGPSKLPITNVQIKDAVDRRGYTLVSNIDNITNRQFLATRKLASPENLDLVSGAGITMAELIVDMESISGSSHVVDNGSRLTIKPTMLYNFDNSKVSYLSDSNITRLMDLNPEATAREVNAKRFVYSPFHTVLDVTDDNFDVRPYYLDNPEITEKVFVGDNASSNMQATISNYYISKVDEGYEFILGFETSETLKAVSDEQIIVQVGYKPNDTQQWASGNAKFVARQDGIHIYSFIMKSNHDLNRNNELHTTNMSMFSEVQNRFATPLQTNFEITLAVGDIVIPGYKTNLLDDLVQTHLLPSRFMCVVRERLLTTLGYDMTKMWRRSRPVLGPENYAKWEHDVPAYYKENEYATDSAGNWIIAELPDGSLDYNLLHRKGDPILDSEGKPVMAYFKNQVKVDSKNQPILIDPRRRLHEISLLMIDGLFYFGTEAAVVEYRKTIPMTFVKWIQNDIAFLDSQLLEMAKMYLYPTNTFGDTTAVVGEVQTTVVAIEQALNVSVYMTQVEFNNVTIRPALTQAIKQTLSDYLDRSIISISDIISRLRETMGAGILSIEVTGLGGSNNFNVLTIKDDAVRLTIKKKLTVLSNQDLIIEDDINFNFMLHQYN